MFIYWRIQTAQQKKDKNMLKIIYFASLREKIGRADEQIDLPAGINTLTDLINHLSDLHGSAWSDAINSTPVLTAVNHDMCERSEPIKDGDEIAFFPPVTGG